MSVTETQGNWNEPETPYGKVKGEPVEEMYPYNKVYESESGHVIEVDDTPGSERLNIFHRSGTFEEFHPNGDKNVKVVRDRYTSILRDDYVHIDGFCNVTIDKALKIVVNAENTESTPSKNVNFDIEVGENSNVNLILKKGNCNLKLESGDANILLQDGDINLTQKDGNFNHNVNGDYNLEVTGHMHVVVGKDFVNEIGGSRDTRIDGKFDNLHVTNGYSETLIENGDRRVEVGLNDHKLIHGQSHLKVKKGRREFITEHDELSVDGDKKIKVAPGNFDIFTDGNISVSTSGTFDGSFGNALRLTTDSSMDVVVGTSGKITTSAGMDIFSASQLKINSNSTVDILSSGVMKLSSGAVMGLNASGALLQTGSVIHLNGPKAPKATAATRARSAQSATLPTNQFLYKPGEMGKWNKTENGKSPASILNESTSKLNNQLNTLNISKEQLGQSTNQLSGLREQLNTAGTDPSKLSSVASSTASLTNNVSGTAGNVNGVLGGMGGVVDDVSNVSGSLVPGSADSLSKFGSGGDFLTGLKEGLGGVVGFVGDIFSTITDIACGIIDAIGGALDFVGKIVSDAIGAVMDAIGSVMDAIGTIIDAATKAITEVLSTIADVIGQVFDAAGNFIGGIVDGIGSVIDAIASIFNGLGGRPSNCGISLALCTEDFSIGVANAPGGG